MESIAIKRYQTENFVIDVEKCGEMWGFDRYEIIIYEGGFYEMDLKFVEMASVETTEYSVVTNHIKNRLKQLSVTEEA